MQALGVIPQLWGSCACGAVRGRAEPHRLGSVGLENGDAATGTVKEKQIQDSGVSLGAVCCLKSN